MTGQQVNNRALNNGGTGILPVQLVPAACPHHRFFRCPDIMPAKRRGFILIAVLVIVGSALLVAGGLMFIAQAEIAGERGAAHAAQSRATAQSGLKVIVQRLDRQRERILAGEPAALDDEQFELYEDGNRLGVVRLLPVGPAGERLVAEAGRLDVNTADHEMLAATGLIEPEIAGRIVAYRENALGRPFQSVEELLSVPGVTAEMLYGPIEDLRVIDDAQQEEGDVTERIAARLASVEARGLADVLTVFAAEPPLQRDGRLRINLNVEWSDRLGARLDERFGEGTGEIVEQLMDEGVTFDSEQGIVAVLRQFEAPEDEWAEILDALRADEQPFLFGRLDINTAPEEALLGLPGIEPEAAAQMLRARDTLTDEERWTITWPLLRQIVDAEQFEALAGRITTRSWAYRVRIAAGEVDADDPRGRLAAPVIYDAVIDLAGPRPRIAHLREITMLQAAAMLALETGDPADDEPPAEDEMDWLEQWLAAADESEADEMDPAGEAHPALDDGLGLLPEEPAWDEDGPLTMDWEEAEAGTAEEADAPAEDAVPQRQRIGRWRPAG